MRCTRTDYKSRYSSIPTIIYAQHQCDTSVFISDIHSPCSLECLLLDTRVTFERKCFAFYAENGRGFMRCCCFNKHLLNHDRIGGPIYCTLFLFRDYSRSSLFDPRGLKGLYTYGYVICSFDSSLRILLLGTTDYDLHNAPNTIAALDQSNQFN